MAEGTKATTAKDIGLLIMRLGLGVAFIFHGLPKVRGVPYSWTQIGEMAHMPQPHIMGLVGGLIEFGGGILLGIGFLARPVALLLFLQMVVAVFFVHLRLPPPMNSFDMFSHAMEDGFVFLGLVFLGAGKFSVDRALFG